MGPCFDFSFNIHQFVFCQNHKLVEIMVFFNHNFIIYNHSFCFWKWRAVPSRKHYSCKLHQTDRKQVTYFRKPIWLSVFLFY
ncbi:hypothetical protein QVD17_32090 [Tagetes erecta]|uniref:Uncharacterized protein n=1 Tax=Tagetes erecta TaxID=13708 RepID=A0AAD8K7D5_TARER|nr:hypothetical protein QVD17_32090 [Tagetes erecta]